MKKNYNYVIYPNSDYVHFSFENPFSSIRAGTINHAYNWAENLMKFNTKATSVTFRSDSGWKTYFVIRKNGLLVRGKLD